MTIQIYDTLSREKRAFEPLTPNRVGLYVCGPTVYDDCHIGHLMGPVLFDTIARWLVARGHEVRFVNNITDIDDKIIDRAARTGEAWDSIAHRYTEQYFEFLRRLGVVTVTDHPRCTEYVPQMIGFVEQLIADGRAYPTSDGVYYEVGKQDAYGKLSGRRVEDMLAGGRVDASTELKHPADFALWKSAKPGEPTWDSPWGPGRPGWHLECSVMSSQLLGSTFDIHGGGDDLKFPHHENEIAQSEAHGDPYARCWMHHGLIQYGGKKIAKSDPRMADPEFSRQFQAQWLLDTHGPPTVRFFLLRGHYRRPIDFEPSNIAAARTGLRRLLHQLGDRLEAPVDVPLDEILSRDVGPRLAALRDRFCAAMDDDFNTGEAVAVLFELAKREDGAADAEHDVGLQLACDLGRLLGMFRPGDLDAVSGRGTGAADDALVGAVVDVLLGLRNDARAAKDFALADGIRDRLTAAGLLLEDSGAETTWERSADGGQAPADAIVRVALALRDEARAAKDFARADTVRDRLAAAGVTVHDGPDGATWEPSA